MSDPITSAPLGVEASPDDGAAGRIRVLPDAVIGKIAAGEVVERPASVVKELVENALDAGARRIVVELEEGGIRLIRVTDDGEGMTAADAELAFTRHATSKLRSERDLGAIATLGFRGEALPSIASVAEVELTTRTRSGSAVRVRAAEGRVLETREAGAPPGTVVTVRKLFEPVPARRKFLKSPATELGHVVELMTRVSLASPDVHVRVLHQGREVIVHPPVGTLVERVRQAFGAERTRGGRQFAEERLGVTVSGFAFSPHHSFASGRYLYLFVNGRPVRDRGLAHAVVEAYASLVPRGRWPGTVAMVAVPPGDVDVNVHPAKHEVRFRQPRVVHDAVLAVIRHALAGASGLGDATPADRVAEAVRSYAQRDSAGMPSPAAGGGRATESASAQVAAAAGTTLGDPREAPRTAPSGLRPAATGFAALRFVGQVFRGYIVCEGADRLVLIDQHAAHERVAFERLRAELGGPGVERQALLVPVTVDLDPRRAEALAGGLLELARLGFEVEPFGDRTFIVREVPALLGGDDPRLLIEDLADGLAELGSAHAAAEAFEAILGRLACHSVIRVGRPLADAEVAGLLADLDALTFGSNCPHGRPVAIELTRAQLERMFGR